MAPSEVHPLVRLWRRAPAYRGRIVRGTVLTALNKLFDVAPELLIGVAIDVVVRDSDSFVAQLFGRRQPRDAAVDPRRRHRGRVDPRVAHRVPRRAHLAAALAKTVQHDLRMDAYRHVQDLELAWFEHRASGRAADDPQRRRQPARALPRRRARTTIILTAVNVVAVGAVFVVISPLLALLAFLPIPVIVGGSLVFQRRLEPALRRRCASAPGASAG